MAVKISILVVFFAIMIGAGIMILNMLFRPMFPVILQPPINCGVVAMIAGFVIVPIVSLISPKIESKKIDDMFICYDVQVSAPAKKNLGN